MARILVTGASGFTGQHLLERLAADAHEVFALVHHGSAESVPLAARTYAADLRDLPAVVKIVEEVRPDHVVHLAAIANVAHGDVADLYSSNIVGTRNLLQALAGLKALPQAVLLASSANIYGNRREGVLTEDMEPAPANDYGVTKVACEVLAQVYGDRLPIITARPFNYTGRGQSENFLIPKILGHVQRRAPVIELGNINVARDFSDVRAVVDSYARLLNCSDAVGGTFNICSGQAHSLAEVLAIAEHVSGHAMKVEVNPTFVRPDDVKTLCGSRARLEAIIGQVPMPTLEDTIRWMLNV